MGMGANCCNHKHTSHMMQLTPWRYLEKSRGRMERASERQEQCTMNAGGKKGGGGGGGGGGGREKVWHGIVRKEIYKCGFK